MPAALRSPAGLLVLSYSLLGIALFWNNGRYLPVPFLLVMLSVACAIAAAVRARREGLIHPDSSVLPLAAGCLVLLIAVQAFFAPADYIDFAWYNDLSAVFFGVSALLAALAYLFPAVRDSSLRPTIFILLLVAGGILKFLVPFVSPAPFIDVFWMLQASARSLLDGLNPYLETFPDIYRGRSLNKPLTTYTYPPGNLLLVLPFFWIIRDVRFGMLLGEIAVLAALWILARRAAGRIWAELLALLFLFHPRGLFVIEQAWTDPLMLGIFSLAVLLWAYGLSRAAAAVFGWFLALKLYVVFFPIHVLLLRARAKLAAWAAIGFAVALVPFAVWDARSLLWNGLLFHASNTFRPDSLSLGVFLSGKTGWTPGRAWTIAVGLAFAAWTLWALRKLPRLQAFLLAAGVTTLAFFALGSQAFCNYYYFAGGLLLLALASAASDR